jgi:hypothetical protein
MNFHQTDYSRYFALRQKATLINMSEERDREQFESLSGYVVSRRADMIELHIPYPVDYDPFGTAAGKTSYKLTSESFGNGIQVMTDLIKVVAGNIFQLQLRGNLELFQRRAAPRISTTIKLFNLRRDLSLSFLRKEWKRIVEYMKSKGLPPTIVLHDTPVNLSIGGIRLSIGATTNPSPLSIFFFDVADSLQPVCALAETVWNKQENDELICGHRFIQILKSDQERIGRYVQDVQRKSGIAATTPRTNWELIDRMTSDSQEPKR